ncbi:hypothetical protein HPP92_005611 [Vanilla planifolia]|uniref:NAC domain-containing protein n=1 Tax=Vanilla planifolia TaxID=51239 RepID=A0A835RU76_VANPL|nr:hypothetical protein HPP92_005611 [Vanilla planifolia]
MASSSSATTSQSGGVPPGIQVPPTDEELLLYPQEKGLPLRGSISRAKARRMGGEERCRIGATPQNEWYFFSHKDRKYPTGSRTNRATIAGFWKATGRDKCIRTTHKKIGMRKTLVFYRGRAPHGQKSDWIMHEYRLDDSDDSLATEDGWVVCRVFKKKTFFKLGGREGSSSQGSDGFVITPSGCHDHSHVVAAQYLNHQQNLVNLNLVDNKPVDLALQYPPLPTPAANDVIPYSHLQIHELHPNRQRFVTGYNDFSGLPGGSPVMVGCEPMRVAGQQGRIDQNANDQWAVLHNLGGGSPGRRGRVGGGGGRYMRWNKSFGTAEALEPEVAGRWCCGIVWERILIRLLPDPLSLDADLGSIDDEEESDVCERRAFFPRPTLASAHFCTDGAVSQSSRFKVFDRDLKRKQRDRAAWLMGGKNDFVDSVAENILDRLERCFNRLHVGLSHLFPEFVGFSCSPSIYGGQEDNKEVVTHIGGILREEPVALIRMHKMSESPSYLKLSDFLTKMLQARTQIGLEN